MGNGIQERMDAFVAVCKQWSDAPQVNPEENPEESIADINNLFPEQDQAISSEA